MESISHYTDVVAAEVQATIRSHPYVTRALSAIILYFIINSVWGFVTSHTTDQYPLVGKASKAFFFRTIRRSIEWFRDGPQLIQDMYEKVGKFWYFYRISKIEIITNTS